MSDQQDALHGGGGVGGRQRHAQKGVAAESRFVGRSVEPAEELVEPLLILDLLTENGVHDLAVDVHHRAANAHPVEPAGIPVPQLDSLQSSRAGAAGDNRPADGSAFATDLDLDGRFPAAVENFAGVNRFDARHLRSVFMLSQRRHQGIYRGQVLNSLEKDAAANAPDQLALPRVRKIIDGTSPVDPGQRTAGEVGHGAALEADGLECGIVGQRGDLRLVTLPERFRQVAGMDRRRRRREPL